ncbi:hypothetical protein AAF712_000153 [Marasmius tenuissimus]|uniref:Transcriptional coactivator p15 (PC4) C-terminal domain-containing protein n=1 Tax=Marasmius tenuissimus TaxID=585030 RepID=A0ABR3AEP3_9AGAR|nr:hypothetical protein PM082_000899 [Marasmius tenuissimus]
MAKRKVDSDNEEEFEDSDASREPTPPPKKKPVKKPRHATVEEASEEEKPASKSKSSKPSSSKGKATQKTVTTSDGEEVAVNKTSEGDSYVDLGKKKRATVRSFKGKALVDIREFYGADGDEKPGKKGISLNEDQWEMLKKSMPVIDRLFKETK